MKTVNATRILSNSSNTNLQKLLRTFILTATFAYETGCNASDRRVQLFEQRVVCNFHSFARLN
jgi:hypothetical protein